MNIIFNPLGAVISTDIEPIRQGDTNHSLRVTFQGKDNSNYLARFTLTRPDGQEIANVLMDADMNIETDYVAKLDQEWFFSKNGTATLTVFLVAADETQIASGQVTFAIERTDYSSDPDITRQEYIELLSELNKRLKIENGIIVVESIDDVETDELLEDQILFDKTSHRFYQWNGENIVEIRKKIKDFSAMAVFPTLSINGRNLSNWSAQLDEVNRVFTLKRLGANPTKEQAMLWLQSVTGSDALPVFDVDKPQASYLMFVATQDYGTTIQVDDIVFGKIQWNESEGALKVYLVKILKTYYSKDEVAAIFATKTSVALKEDKSNKIDNIQDATSNNQYIGALALKNEFQNLREVAEGKSNTFVLNYHHDVDYIVSHYQVGQKIGNLNNDGSITDITNEFITHQWTDEEKALYKNGLLNTQKAAVVFNFADYFLILQSGNVDFTGFDYVRVSKAYIEANFKIGDSIIISDINVPDRWFDKASNGLAVLRNLETTKVDLTNYNTKQEITTLLEGKELVQEQATFGSSSVYNSGITSKIDLMFTAIMTSITFTELFASVGDNMPIWTFVFQAGAGFTLTFPSGATVKWLGGNPIFTQGKIYQVCIKKGTTNNEYLATLGEF